MVGLHVFCLVSVERCALRCCAFVAESVCPCNLYRCCCVLLSMTPPWSTPATRVDRICVDLSEKKIVSRALPDDNRILEQIVSVATVVNLQSCCGASDTYCEINIPPWVCVVFRGALDFLPPQNKMIVRIFCSGHDDNFIL